MSLPTVPYESFAMKSIPESVTTGISGKRVTSQVWEIHDRGYLGIGSMWQGCGSCGVSVAGRCPARSVPGGRRTGQGHRDVILRALQCPQDHIAGVNGPWPG